MKKLIIIFVSFLLLSPICLPASQNSASGEIVPAPWSGYWWSRRTGLLVKGWDGHQPSPLERYDAYVQSRTGRNPGAHAWEMNPVNNHYNPNAEQWEGHCNGWAAASILTVEPRERRIRNGIVFEVADQKGLLSEQYMNTYCNFYGNRTWGNPNDIPGDIPPDEFHRLLLHYISTGKTAIIADIDPSRQVWNFPIYKFESSWRGSFFNSDRLRVTTTCYFADDQVSTDFLGTKWFRKTYTYDLFLDPHGNVVDGAWTGGSRNDHPDFIWVPTSDAPNPPNSNLQNPKVDPKFVREIVEGPMHRDFRTNRSTSPDAVLRDAGLDPSIMFDR